MFKYCTSLLMWHFVISILCLCQVMSIILLQKINRFRIFGLKKYLAGLNNKVKCNRAFVTVSIGHQTNTQDFVTIGIIKQKWLKIKSKLTIY